MYPILRKNRKTLMCLHTNPMNFFGLMEIAPFAFLLLCPSTEERRTDWLCGGNAERRLIDMMTLDEAIAKEKEMSEPCSIPCTDRCDCTECRKSHEQIAELLEELKAYREIGTVEECKNSVLDILKAYNKAIDDLINKICMHFADWKYSEDDKCIKDIIELASESVEEIAEQLKAGRENE